MRNRFKGLDLIDRVPDELWTEVRDIVQETGIKTIPIEKECKKAKWLSGEALQIAVERREAKSKGEKEKYKHLNAEFQRIARRDKKAFFSDQCKEIEDVLPLAWHAQGKGQSGIAFSVSLGSCPVVHSIVFAKLYLKASEKPAPL